MLPREFAFNGHLRRHVDSPVPGIRPRYPEHPRSPRGTLTFSSRRLLRNADLRMPLAAGCHWSRIAFRHLHKRRSSYLCTVIVHITYTSGRRAFDDDGESAVCHGYKERPSAHQRILIHKHNTRLHQTIPDVFNSLLHTRSRCVTHSLLWPRHFSTSP